MLRNKKGFTLVELLIVVAILAVLAAVAIPLYSAQLEKARVQVDAANLRSAESMATADYLLNNYTGKHTYTFSYTDNQLAINGCYGNDDAKITANRTDSTGDNIEAQASANKETGETIVIVLGDAADITSAAWAVPFAD